MIQSSIMKGKLMLIVLKHKKWIQVILECNLGVVGVNATVGNCHLMLLDLWVDRSISQFPVALVHLFIVQHMSSCALGIISVGSKIICSAVDMNKQLQHYFEVWSTHGASPMIKTTGVCDHDEVPSGLFITRGGQLPQGSDCPCLLYAQSCAYCCGMLMNSKERETITNV